MEKQGTLNKDDGIISILDLPEQIFRNIFQHIGIDELFYTIRKLNQDIRKYVDDYLPLKGVFVLIGKHSVHSRLIRIFKWKGNNYVTHLSVAQPFPMSDHSSHMKSHLMLTQLDMLPLPIPSNETQGPLLFAIHSSIPMTYRPISIVPFEKQFFAGKLAVDLHEFDVSTGHWKLLKTRYGNLNSQIVSCSLINDSTFIVFEI